MKANIELAVILEEVKEESIDFDISKIKSIVSVKNPDSFLEPYQIKLVQWIAKHYFSSIHNSLNLFFPKNLKEKISKETLKKVDIEEENKAKKNNTDVILNKAQNKAFEEVKNSTNNKILLY